MKEKIFAISAVLIVLISGGVYCMTKLIEHQDSPYNVSGVLSDKHVKLYRRGFRLLEEQLATYIKEHYSGVSKIEFSPIFVQGGDGQSMFSSKIVFAIYDKNQNKAYVGGKIGNHTYATYGDSWDVILGFDGVTGEEAIDLRIAETETIDVSKYDHLPDLAKLSILPKLDSNLKALVKDGQLVGVNQSEEGSPKVEIFYNTEIRKGSVMKWPN